MIRLIALDNRYFLRIVAAEQLPTVIRELQATAATERRVTPDTLQISRDQYLRLLPRAHGHRGE